MKERLVDAMSVQGWRRITIGDFWLSQNRHGVWCRTWFDPVGRQTRRVSLGTKVWEQAAALLALDSVLLKGAPEAVDHTALAIGSAAGPFERQAGVYFLFDGDELVYVGQSNHVPARLLDHELGVHGNPEKRWNRVAVLRFPADTLDEKERMFIARLRPKYNRPTLMEVLACP